MVRPKKSLGQHFLKDENIARNIVGALSLQGDDLKVIEIGPGTGVLTKYLCELKGIDLRLIEIDRESVAYLKGSYPNLKGKIIEADFLELDLEKIFPESCAIIGNFPYNISSQIFFKVLDHRNKVHQVVGMLQKEVAERICEKKGSKVYGILSVLTQAFYEAEYLFTVPPEVFNPPPKVDSGVLRLRRKADYSLPCDEKLFFRVVKTGFQQRRKTLRNSLKSFNFSDNLKEDTIFDLRPEQLTVEQFIEITQKITADGV